MAFRIEITSRLFHFKQPAGTSRGVYLTRKSWFVRLSADDVPEVVGIGECAPLPNLSCDACEDYESVLRKQCDRLCETGQLDGEALLPYPSMLFGLETAMEQWRRRGSTALSDSPFARGTEGIPINGLIWMGTFEEMAGRLEEKLQQGFRCIKLKIGAIDFEREIGLIRRIRARFPKNKIELRVDANGAFAPHEALSKLEQLARYDLHSIEQPIRQGQWKELAELCRRSPLPIALDEELIGIHPTEEKVRLLDTIHPQYIVLKPSLHGGMYGTEEWIRLARKKGIGSWITSALESNVGLNAIAHLAARMYGSPIAMPQGLGTGQLFVDNIAMPLQIKGDRLWYLQNS